MITPTKYEHLTRKSYFIVFLILSFWQTYSRNKSLLKFSGLRCSSPNKYCAFPKFPPEIFFNVDVSFLRLLVPAMSVSLSILPKFG